MPEPERLVVVNTTPIIALTIADQLPLLQHLYSQVLIPLEKSPKVSVAMCPLLRIARRCAQRRGWPAPRW